MSFSIAVREGVSDKDIQKSEWRVRAERVCDVEPALMTPSATDIEVKRVWRGLMIGCKHPLMNYSLRGARVLGTSMRLSNTPLPSS